MQLTPEAMLTAYGRTLWVISSARVCPIHKLALVPPPEDSSRHEFVDAWLPWMFEVVEGELDQEITAGGLYEDHVVRRLNGDDPEGWANSFPVGALGAICEVLGVSVIHGKTATLGRLSQEELATATSAGFAVVNDGPPEVLAYFDRLRLSLGKPQDRPQACYGKIYDWLHLEAWKGSACEAVKVKPNRLGGLTKARQVRDFGVAVGWQMHIEDVGGSALADTAALHLAASTPEPNRLASWLSHDYISVDPVSGQGVRNLGGHVVPPSLPGLGVTPDLNMLGAPVAVYS